MTNTHLSTFLKYLQSDKTEFQLAQRSYFLVSFTFPNGDPVFEKNMPKYFQTGSNNDNFFKRDYLTFLVQTIDLPKLSVSGGAKNGDGYSIVNFEGQAKGPGKFIVLPDGAKSIDIKFLDTETPVFEHYFYPWMNEVASFEYSTSKHPFARANIYVDLLSNDLKRITQTYIIRGAYPHSIELPELKQAPSTTPTRTVTFDFNNLELSDNNGATFNDNNFLPDDFVKHVCDDINNPTKGNKYQSAFRRFLAQNSVAKFNQLKGIPNRYV